MERVLKIAPPNMASQQEGLETVLSVFERTVGSVFRCRHRQMGWPITREGRTYRACLSCGMRRGFDTKTWKMFGSFYRRL